MVADSMNLVPQPQGEKDLYSSDLYDKGKEVIGSETKLKEEFLAWRKTKHAFMVLDNNQWRVVRWKKSKQ